MGNEHFSNKRREPGIPSRKRVREFYKRHPDSGVLVDINYGIPKFTGTERFKNGPTVKSMIRKMQLWTGNFFLPDSTFIISTADTDYANWRKAIGKGLWLNSTEFPREAILHPLWYFVTRPHQKAVKIAEKPPWRLKMDKIIWRGSTTGKNGNGKNGAPSRAILVDFSERFPHLVDAKFTNFCDNSGKRLEKQYKTPAETISPEDQQNYRYIFNIDGHGASYGLYWQLLSGSHVVQWSNQHMWFTPFFRGTMTEIKYPEQLLPKIQKLENSSAKRKTQVAKNVAKRVFNDKFVYNHLLKTIKNYAKNQTS